MNNIIRQFIKVMYTQMMDRAHKRYIEDSRYYTIKTSSQRYDARTDAA